MTWSRNFYLGPAEIASFVFLVLFKDRGLRVSLKFYLFVPDVNQGTRRRGGTKIGRLDSIFS